MRRRRPSRPSPSPLRGRYLVQNPGWRALLSVNDALLHFLRRRSAATSATPPRRVLVCVGGHLGDAIIATAALSQLQEAAPDIEIGVLSGSWNRKILEPLPFVRRFHATDHWKLSRRPVSLAARYLEYRRSRARAVREIRNTSYDAAVDLYPHYPNFATTVAAAGIPVRIGYGSGGFGALYSREVDWTPGRSVSGDHRELMEALLPDVSWPTDGAYRLGPGSRAEDERVAAWLQGFGAERKRYAVLHPGGGSPQRDWPIEHWIAIARDLVRLDIPVILSGAGPADATKLLAIAQAVPGTINLCDQLPWPVLRPVIAQAAVVLSVNTVTMHLAAAEGTPCVAVMSGIDAPNRWTPDTADVRVLTHPVSCAPCHRSRGCDEMLCLRGIQPVEMLRAAEPFLPRTAE